MFNGKMKAFTMSYDDGISQDIRLIEILNRYGLKATFNLNSGLFGQQRILQVRGVPVHHNRLKAEDVRSVYAGHEVAAHTVTHAMLPVCSKEEIVREVELDRLKLSELTGYKVVGMAYANGGQNNNAAVAQVIRDWTGVQYARTITCTGDFTPQNNLLRFNPTVFHLHMDEMFALGEQFLAMQPETPQLFYVWGHSYELDAGDTWGRFEEFCQMISGHPDVFYGTNREVLL